MRILIIDDDQSILRGLTRLAKSRGYDAVTASTGYRALQMLNGDPSQFHAVICDMELLDTTGADVFRQAPEQCRPLFVFFTGSPELVKKELGDIPNRIFSKSQPLEMFDHIIKEMEPYQ
jgi:DNA-binding response OmpR family regulator